MNTTEIKAKMQRLARKYFGMALGTFGVAYTIYHYVTCEGFTREKQFEPGKPMVTLLFGVLGVDFLAESMMVPVAARTLLAD